MNMPIGLEEDFYVDIENDENEEKNSHAVSSCGTDLTMLAQNGDLEERFGRENELKELMEVLVRRKKNNPLLIGESGIGKTAIVELFAQKMINNLVPFTLQGRTIISLDIKKIVKYIRDKDDLEPDFQVLISELISKPNVLLFIDDIQNVINPTNFDGSFEIANILKSILSRGEVQCIGTSPIKEYQAIKKDSLLSYSFQEIIINETSITDTISILYSIRPKLEKYHNITILPAALKMATELSSRYIQDQFLPEKAIDLLDKAAARQVVLMTDKHQTSVLCGIINSGLKKLGELKLAAFRQGDIASEFIFNELDNAYKTFLVQWLENPLDVSTKNSNLNISTIKENDNLKISNLNFKLFKKMKISILSRIESLANSRQKTIYNFNTLTKFENLLLSTDELNCKKFKKVITSEIKFNNFKKEPSIITKLSLYRISILLYSEWINIKNLKYFSKKKVNYIFFDKEVKNFVNLKSLKIKILRHISNLKKISIKYKIQYKNTIDFQIKDLEKAKIKLYQTATVEKNRINLFKKFLIKLKPILNKATIESLKENSKIDFTEKELNLIYALIGHFQSGENEDFLSVSNRLDNQLSSSNLLKNVVDVDDIREIVSEIAGIPLKAITSSESEKLLNLEKTLHKRIIGQEEAISAVSKAIRRSRLGIQTPNRPIASFFFCGPTGVGKTEVTKTLASTMFGSEKDMIRFDMSEFMEKFSISRLIGAPPGYAGYEDGGQLTNSVRKKPYSVVLFDEIEKGHPEILNILLQILEDGRLTDSQKSLVNFENTIIIMTSNAASEDIQEAVKNYSSLSTKKIDNKKSATRVQKLETTSKSKNNESYYQIKDYIKSPTLGDFIIDINNNLKKKFKDSFLDLTENEILDKFILNKIKNVKNKSKTLQEINQIDDLTTVDEELATETKQKKNLKKIVIKRLSTMFLPEFLNRLDDIIVFQPLKAEELRKICDIMIQNLISRLTTKNIYLTVSDSVKLKLTKEGYNPRFGARPLRRLITKYIEDLVSENILKKPLTKNNRKMQIKLNNLDKIIIVN